MIFLNFMLQHFYILHLCSLSNFFFSSSDNSKISILSFFNKVIKKSNTEFIATHRNRQNYTT